ncbi:hypothetical protein GCM10022198_16070 [Klugiella xanthotipulae]|uniref:Uncharacterized protein n=1 Tax=Klugiella xanthotipulae TaxID=244735 RepID=A0A543HH31_9MICO|nr:hypothetical protein [Klugiella xanthotipulae]TQM57645.1 hypothetical protein FB466_2640 [Klugiella xanthotipulae]
MRPSGPQHIQRHAALFRTVGVATAQIQQLLRASLSTGEKVGKQGTRPLYAVEFDGRMLTVAVAVAANGHILGANPNSLRLNGTTAGLTVQNAGLPAEVRVAAEWGQHPLWIAGRYGAGNVTGPELGLSTELWADLQTWAAAYDEGFNPSNPSASAPLPAGFTQRGYLLTVRVQKELGNGWTVAISDPESDDNIILPRLSAHH